MMIRMSLHQTVRMSYCLFSGTTHQPPSWPPCLQSHPFISSRSLTLNVTLSLPSSEFLLSSSVPVVHVQSPQRVT